MNNITAILILILFCCINCKTTKPAAEVVPAQAQPTLPAATPAQQPPVSFSDPSTWLLGFFKQERLYQQPHSAWFVKGFDEYQFNRDLTNKLSEINRSGITVKIVLGTWCPDSRREVPRFMRIVKEINFPSDRIQLIGVDNSKVAPVDNYESLDIQRVPTFIFYKNNVEAGRIIENPTTSLEQDMLNILTGMNNK